MPAIDRDVPCAACGYNLRGLKSGGNCPECGVAIPFDRERVVHPLLAGTMQRKTMTLWGLTAVASSAGALAFVQITCAVSWSFSD